jgi:chromosomal replication initiation ATPase DnaA
MSAPTEMTEAERLSCFADVPLELAELVVSRAEQNQVDLRTLRRSDRTPAVVPVRHAIAQEARAHRGIGGAPVFSFWQIGRALNRDHTSIIYAVRKAAA